MGLSCNRGSPSGKAVIDEQFRLDLLLLGGGGGRAGKKPTHWRTVGYSCHKRLL